MIYNNILEAIGNTPLIKLNKINNENNAEVFAKYEAVNVGGSIKIRTAYNMIAEAEKEGKIKEDTIIVEPTSGNQGISLALIGAVRGYRVIIIMPDSVSEERRKLITQYGAEIILIHDEGDIGRCINECINKAESMAKADSRVYIPDQFSNPNNPLIHENVTGKEILRDIGSVDGFCSGIGTGGTISGVGKVLKEKNPDIEIWAVEPENAAILAGGSITTHIQMGIGDGVVPKNLDKSIYDYICIISDREALETSRRLAKEEGILCGISGGTNVSAALKMAKILGRDKVVVTIIPDTGERYFSTELFKETENLT